MIFDYYTAFVFIQIYFQKQVEIAVSANLAELHCFIFNIFVLCMFILNIELVFFSFSDVVCFHKLSTITANDTCNYHFEVCELSLMWCNHFENITEMRHVARFPQVGQECFHVEYLKRRINEPASLSWETNCSIVCLWRKPGSLLRRICSFLSWRVKLRDIYSSSIRLMSQSISWN